MNEDDIISFLYQEGQRPVDDCAYLADHQLLITADSMVEHTHFQLEWTTPQQLAHKLFQVNLSDIAASGGDPIWCILQMGFPQNFDTGWIQDFANSFRYQCESFNCKLIGGDTFRSDNVVFSITMAGHTTRYIQRQALAGDSIYLTGEIGWSLIGLKYLQAQQSLTEYQKQKALKRHLTPNARLSWSQELRKYSEIHGMMDLSDGLLIDATRFAKAANLVFAIYLDKLPSADQLPLTQLQQATSGEEYELLFTAPPGLSFNFPVRQIGSVLPKSKNQNNNSSAYLQLFQNFDDQQPIDLTQLDLGFQHFQK
ncbi:MAG: thiamine-phosphate kinase [Leptonema sp. (in: Bacteria)]|nr:thiamine-phosphate kinase [Leptonema sp. (in: bacteria)]